MTWYAASAVVTVIGDSADVTVASAVVIGASRTSSLQPEICQSKHCAQYLIGILRTISDRNFVISNYRTALVFLFNVAFASAGATGVVTLQPDA